MRQGTRGIGVRGSGPSRRPRNRAMAHRLVAGLAAILVQAGCGSAGGIQGNCTCPDATPGVDLPDVGWGDQDQGGTRELPAREDALAADAAEIHDGEMPDPGDTADAPVPLDPAPDRVLEDPSVHPDATDEDLPPACPSPPAPWASWPLDRLEEGIYRDVAGNGHGAAPKGMFASVPGIRGNAASGPGDGWLEVERPRAMTPAGTLAFWIRPPSGVEDRSRTVLQQAGILDRDGLLDVVLANAYSDQEGPGTDSFIYRNRGAGDFDPVPVRLPTWSATGVAAGDLDGDGWLDLVISHQWDRLADPWRTNVYRGSPEGPVPDPSGALNSGSGGVAIADLDGDGWLDLVFGAGVIAEGKGARVFFGAPDGFDPGRTLDLPGGDPRGVTVADLDGDRLPDVVVSNLMGHASAPDWTRIFRNGPGGIDPLHPLLLPSDSSYGNTAMDLDQDGFPDLVVSSYIDERAPGDYTDDRYDVSSWIHPGSRDGFVPANRIAIPSFGGLDASAADLDGDGWPDLLMANFYDGRKDNRGLPVDPLDVPSRVYFGSRDGFSPDRRVELPAHGNHGLVAGDLDGDGWPEVVVPSSWDGTRHDLDTRIYRGGPAGPYPSSFRSLPGQGTGGAAIPGSPYCAAGTVYGSQPCRHGSLRVSWDRGRIRADLHDDAGRLRSVSAAGRAGEWMLVVVTWDAGSGSLALFLDGQEADRIEGTIRLGQSFPWRMRMFADAENLDRFDGTLDDVRLWDRALPAGAIRCLAGEGL